MDIKQLVIPEQKRLSVDDELNADIDVMRRFLGLMRTDYSNRVDSLIFCGFDGSRLLSECTHGERRALFGLTASEWALQLTVYCNTSNQPSSYAFLPSSKCPRPTVAAYDSAGLIPALEHPDLMRAFKEQDYDTVNSFGEGLVGGPHWYAPEPGSSLDDVLVTVIELLPEHDNVDIN